MHRPSAGGRGPTRGRCAGTLPGAIIIISVYYRWRYVIYVIVKLIHYSLTMAILVNICIYIYIYIYTHTHVCTHIYIYIYIYIGGKHSRHKQIGIEGKYHLRSSKKESCTTVGSKRSEQSRFATLCV